jgi:NTE family protein
MRTTAVVLGAGGLAGQAFEAGVLKALHEVTGFDARDADLIIGTSAGSLTGSSLRFGISASDLYSYIREEPLSEEGQEIFDRIGPVPEAPVLSRPRFLKRPSGRLMLTAARHPLRSRAGLLCAVAPTGTIDMKPFGEVFRNLTGDGWCDDALWIVAARLPLGERIVFGREGSPVADVPTAVCASCAIPGVFAPVEVEGVNHVDGGVHSPTNADLIAEAGEFYDDVIVVSPMSANRRAVRTRRVNPVRMACRALLGREVRALRRRGMNVRTFQPGMREQRLMGMNALDEARCPDVAQAAYEATVRRLERRRAHEERLAA